MRLLVEARDEALGRAGRRAGGGTRQPRDEGEGESDERAAGGEHRCHVCRRVFARGELPYRRTVEGFWMRASERRVPMCPACAAAVWDRREKAARLKAALLIVAVGALVLGLLFAA